MRKFVSQHVIPLPSIPRIPPHAPVTTPTHAPQQSVCEYSKRVTLESWEEEEEEEEEEEKKKYKEKKQEQEEKDDDELVS